MAVESPPGFEQGSTYAAVVLRRAFGTLLQRGATIASVVGGLVGPTDMQVTAGSGMQVLVGTGEAWVPGSSVTNQSGYYARVESSTALSIAASDETNPRIETIIAKVIDKAYAGTEETFSVAVVKGVATSGATLANKSGAGAVPASSLVLAYVLVPAKAASIEAADIENVAGPLLLGPSAPLTLVARSSSLTAHGNELVEATGAITVTSPLAAVGRCFGVLANGHAVTIKPGSGKIYGDLIEGATEVKLVGYQHLVLQSDGTNWFIIAGESTRTQKYGVTAEGVSGTNYAITEGRSHVAATCSAVLTEINVAGVQLSTEGSPHGAAFVIEVGQEWTIRTTGAVNYKYNLKLF